MPIKLCFCGKGPQVEAIQAERIDAMAEVGRKLWRQLFLEVRTLQDLAEWEQRIPNYECKCRAFYDYWKKDHQTIEVDGEIPFEWKWSLKSAINRKLDHADLTLEEARAFWSSVASAQ